MASVAMLTTVLAATMEPSAAGVLPVADAEQDAEEAGRNGRDEDHQSSSLGLYGDRVPRSRPRGAAGRCRPRRWRRRSASRA